MAFNVTYVGNNKTLLPFNGVSKPYLANPSTGPTRADITVTIMSDRQNADGSCDVLVCVQGGADPKTGVQTPIDSNFTPITSGTTLGFSVRTGKNWPNVTNSLSYFQLHFDPTPAKDWPSAFQVQVGVVNGGTGQNTVYVFSKGVAEDEVETEVKSAVN